MQSDLSYYRRRASEERTAALQSRHLGVRRAHVEMAKRYEERVRRLSLPGERVHVPISEAV